MVITSEDFRETLIKLKSLSSNIFIWFNALFTILSAREVFLSSYKYFSSDPPLIPILIGTLFFFAFYLQEYLNNRGLTIDYEKEVPGLVSKDAKEIIEAINNNKYNIKLVEQFRKKYVTNTKDCTKKIVEFVKELMK